MKTDVTIIGAGPAGATAAIQLKRAGRSITLLEKSKVGGLLHSASLIENYIGFPSGIKGLDLAENISQHLANLDIEICNESVSTVLFTNNLFQIKTAKQTVESKYLIVASGTGPKKIPVDIPEDCKEKIHSEITDLYNIENKQITIIGGGDAAFDYGLNLSRSNKTTILMRVEECCLPLLYSRATNNSNIDIINNVNLEKIEKRENQLELTVKKDNELQQFNTDHLLFAIGREPNIDFLRGLEDTEELKEKNRLFIIGDAQNGLFRQASIAAGDGVRAAMEILIMDKMD